MERNQQPDYAGLTAWDKFHYESNASRITGRANALDHRTDGVHSLR